MPQFPGISAERTAVPTTQCGSNPVSGVALWLVFSKLKLVRWGWASGTVAVLVGAFILAVFLALFNYLTPSGKVTVAGRVVEVIPNVTGHARRLRRKTPTRRDVWHLDEVVTTINGEKRWLWRAVDQDGYILDEIVQARRDTKAAKRLLTRLLRKQACRPKRIITDKLRS
jgi:hypothetical protein